MKTLKFVSFLLLAIASCSIKNDKTETKFQNTLSDSLSKVNSTITTFSNNDTLIVDKNAAIFYSPDSTQIAKRKKEIGEEDFYIGADDYLNYMHTSHDFLESSKLTILDAKDKKYLKFVKNDKTQTIIKLDTLSELWGIYFFDPNKKEKLVDMTIIDEEHRNYFK